MSIFTHVHTRSCFHHPPGLPLPSKLDWYTAHPPPGLVPSPLLFHITQGNFNVNFRAHTCACFGQHHPPGPPMLNLPPGPSPPSPSQFLLTTHASTAGEPLKTLSIWGAVPHFSLSVDFYWHYVHPQLRSH